MAANHFARNWLGDPATALYAIIAVGFPWVAGTSAPSFPERSRPNLRKSVFDACLIDGCTGLRRIWQVDIPLVLGQVRFHHSIGHRVADHVRRE